MNRRTFLTLGAAGVGFLAGCPADSQTDPQTASETTTRTPTPTMAATVTSTRTPTEHTAPETPTTTETPRENPNTIFVAPEGSTSADGSKEDPLNSLQNGIDRANPGQTVYAKPGRYEESLHTVRSGKPDQPITITGPSDAIVTGEPDRKFGDGCRIRHSHIHITGLTFEGLKNPSKPDDPLSYMLRAVTCIPKEPKYSEDIVIKPHAVGNTRGSMIDLNFVKDVELGEFQVIGPGGLKWLLTDRNDHWGEIVYVGQPPPTSLNIIDFNDELSESGLDLSNNIHIHHIVNSAGHEHSEIVNTKLGTHDVLVEYCTDDGGSQNTETYPAASIRLQSHDATVRWCKLRNGEGNGVEIGSWKARDRQKEKPDSELIEAEKRGGRDNAIYGNQVVGFDHSAFNFQNSDSGQTPEAQRHFCGNEYNGSTDGNPDKECSDDLPEGDGIGHLGGDSPWA